MKTPARLVALVPLSALCLVLAACGNKGSLVLPASAPAYEQPPPADVLPPESDPTEAGEPVEIPPPPAADPPAATTPEPLPEPPPPPDDDGNG